MNEFLKQILSPKEKEVILHYENGMNYKEFMNQMDVENHKSVDNAIQRVRRKVNTIKKIEEMIEMLKGKVKKEYLKSTVSKEKIEQLEELHEIQLPLDYLMFVEEISNGYKFENGSVLSVEEAVKKMESRFTPLLVWDENILSYQSEEEVYYLNGKPIQTSEGIKTYQSFIRRISELI